MATRRRASEIAWSVSQLLSGVTAGMFLMVCFSYYPLLPRLADHAAIELHQESIVLQRALLRLATLSSGVTCLVVILLFSDRTARRWLIASLACLIMLVAYTNYAVIPLNQTIAAWTADAPPPGWKTLFAEMIFREQLRSALPALSFVLQLAAWRRLHRDGVATERVR